MERADVLSCFVFRYGYTSLHVYFSLAELAGLDL